MSVYMYIYIYAPTYLFKFNYAQDRMLYCPPQTKKKEPLEYIQMPVNKTFSVEHYWHLRGHFLSLIHIKVLGHNYELYK